MGLKISEFFFRLLEYRENLSFSGIFMIRSEACSN